MDFLKRMENLNGLQRFNSNENFLRYVSSDYRDLIIPDSLHSESEIAVYVNRASNQYFNLSRYYPFCNYVDFTGYHDYPNMWHYDGCLDARERRKEHLSDFIALVNPQNLNLYSIDELLACHHQPYSAAICRAAYKNSLIQDGCIYSNIHFQEWCREENFHDRFLLFIKSPLFRAAETYMNQDNIGIVVPALYKVWTQVDHPTSWSAQALGQLEEDPKRVLLQSWIFPEPAVNVCADASALFQQISDLLINFGDPRAFIRTVVKDVAADVFSQLTFNNMVGVITCLLSIASAIVTPGILTITTAVSSLVALLCPNLIIDKVWKVVKSLTDMIWPQPSEVRDAGANAVEMQGPQTDSRVRSMVDTLFDVFNCTDKQFKTGLLYMTFLLRVENLWRNRENLIDMFEACLRTIKKVIRFILRRSEPIDNKTLTWAEQSRATINTWREKVLRLDTPLVRDSMYRNSKMRREIEEAYNEGNRLVTHIVTEELKGGPTHVVRDTHRIIAKLYQAMLKTASARTQRRTPFCVYMYGDPGVGKSTVMQDMMVRMATTAGFVNPDDDGPVVFTKAAGNNYFDTYAGQPVVYFDDFAQVLDSDGEEFKIFLAMMTNSPYIPPMADLPSKGNYFNSEFVFCASNTSHPRDAHVSSERALWRRRDILVKANLKREYMKEGTEILDKTKVDGTFNHLSFDLMDAIRPNRMIRQGLDYPSLLRFALHEYAEHRMVEDNRIETLKQLGVFRGDVEPQGPVFPEPIPIVGIKTNGDYMVCTQHGDKIMLDGVDVSVCKYINVCVRPDEENYVFRVEPNVPEDHEYDIELLSRMDMNRFYDWWDIASQVVQPQPKCSWWSTSIDKFKSVVSGKTTTTSKVVLSMSAGIIATGALLFGIKLYKSLKTVQTQALIPSGGSYVRRTQQKIVPREKIVIQGSNQNLENFQNITRNHMAIISPSTNDEHALQCLRVGGTIICVPYHFFAGFTEGTNFKVRTREGIFEGSLDFRKILRIPKHDICFWDMGMSNRSVKRIAKHFIDEKDLSHANNVDMMLATMCGYDDSTYQFDVNYQVSKLFPDMGDGFHASIPGEEITYADGWRYNAATIVGDCGAPIVLLDNRINAHLAGFHVALHQKKQLAIGEIITRQMVERAYDFFQNVTDEPITPSDIVKEPEEAKVQLQGAFTLLGCVSKPVFQAPKTDLRRSLLFDQVMVHTKEPAVLKVNDHRLDEDCRGKSLIGRSVEKYGVETHPFPASVTRIVEDSMVDYGIAKIKPIRSTVGPLTVDQSVNGMEFDYYDRMNMHTSPGRPYVNMVGAVSGKRWLFKEVDGVFTIDNKELEKRVNQRLEAACKGEFVESVSTDCLKDEKRDFERIRRGKTRTFTIMPVDYTIVFRMFFLDFIAAFYKARISTFSAVGLDPTSIEWTELYAELRTMGTAAFDDDQSNFDGTLKAQCMEIMLVMVNSWYKHYGRDEWKPEHDLVRKVLLTEASHCTRLMLDLVYITQQGNPSGNPGTVVINTIVHECYKRVAWLLITAEKAPELSSMTAYYSNVRTIIYGDDGATTVSESVKDIYNGISIAQCLKPYGHVFTPAEKHGQMIPYKNISELRFLKRGFKPHPERPYLKLAPIEVATIGEMLNWHHKADDPVFAIKTNCNTALMEAYHHDQGFFDDLRRRIITALEDQSIDSSGLYGYAELDRLFALKCGQKVY